MNAYYDMNSDPATPLINIADLREYVLQYYRIQAMGRYLFSSFPPIFKAENQYFSPSILISSTFSKYKASAVWGIFG